ncbi:hydrolase of alpha/beta superfamily protein [Salinisphaera sp. C84B14]
MLVMGGFAPAMAQPDLKTVVHPEAAAALRHESIVDPATGRVYELLISQPQAPAPDAGYPVVFLFDGNRTAPAALAWLQSHELADRVLVVGLGYPDTVAFNIPRRFEDLTPSAVAGRAGSGQARAFLDFVEARVKPRIARDYPLDPARTALYGHSLGGLAVLFDLAHHPARFSAYFAASPSLWWDDVRVMPQLQQAVQGDSCARSAPKTVIITVGAKEQPLNTAQTDNPERAAKLARRQMVANAAQANEILARCPAFDVDYRLLAGAGHGAALDRGLFHALARWLGRAATAEPTP